MSRLLPMLLASTALVGAPALIPAGAPFLSLLMPSPAWALGGAGAGGASGGADSNTGAGGNGTAGTPGVSGGGGGGAGATGGDGGGVGSDPGAPGGASAGAAGASGTGSLGGGGGAHGIITPNLPTLGVTGGAGGAGGGSGGSFGGGGGAGGFGAVLSGNGILGTLGVAVTGGAGGDGGAGGIAAGGGGTGGAGLVFTAGDGATVTIGAAVAGGAGASSPGGPAGAGGVGILIGGSASNLTINAAVSGGLSGDGATRAAALSVSGTSTSLTIGATGSLVGGVIIGNGTTLVLQQPTDATISGVISGAGSLSKQGAGVLTLGGANTFSGTTLIGGGTLALLGAGSLSSGDITIGNATLRADSDRSITNSIIATGGSSTVAAASGRSLTLTGNLFIDPNATLVFGSTTASGTVVVASDTIIPDPTGSLRVAGGTLRDQGGSLSQVTSQVSTTTISAGGTLDFNGASGVIRNLLGSGTLTNSGFTTIRGGNFSGVIAGSGLIAMSGPGTLILSGNNTYTGNTNVGQGTLQIGDGGSTGTLGAGNTFISQGATLAFNRSDSGLVYAGNIRNGGTLVQRGSGQTTLSGVIADLTGESFVNVGSVRVEAGTLNLTGANTYTGATVVGGGALLVNGSIASSSGVTVNDGGVLGGSGQLPGVTVNAGGSISPGNSVGTINIGGNLTLTAGSTTVIEVQGPNADRINVSGSVRLAGTLRLVPLGGAYAFGTPYTLIQGQSVSGSFGTVTTQGSFGAGVTTTLDITDTLLRLTLSPAALVPLGGSNTGNQRSVAAGLDRAVAGGADVSAFFPLYNLPANQIPRGLDQLAGQVHTAGMRSLVDTSFQMMDAMLDSARPTPREGSSGIYSAWASAFGGGYRMGANGGVGSAAVTGSNGGMATGTDIRIFPGITIGFAAAGAGTASNVASGLGRADSSQLQGGGYGIGSFGPMRLGFAVTTAGADVTSRRQVGFMGPGNLDASYTTQAISTRMEGSWKFSGLFPGLDLTPSFIFQNIRFQNPGFTETGPSPLSAAALTVSSRTQGTTRTEIGLRADMDLGNRINAWGRLAYAAYTQRDSGQTASFASLPNSTFMVTGARPEVSAALISGGIEWRVLPGVIALARFDSEMSSNGFAGRGTARVRMGF